MTERELSTLHETDHRSGALPVLPLGILLSVGLASLEPTSSKSRFAL
jgi:hypothetical protein